MKLPDTITDYIFYASKKDGGLSPPRLVKSVPRVKVRRSILLSSDSVIREFGIAMGLEREINETCHTLGLRLPTTL